MPTYNSLSMKLILKTLSKRVGEMEHILSNPFACSGKKTLKTFSVSITLVELKNSRGRGGGGGNCSLVKTGDPASASLHKSRKSMTVFVGALHFPLLGRFRDNRYTDLRLKQDAHNFEQVDQQQSFL